MTTWDGIKYFKPSEFGFSKDLPTKTRQGRNMVLDFVRKLDLLRIRFGKPMTINSGWRSPAHNKAVKGSPNSPHLLGRAADISTIGWQPWERKEFVRLARELGFKGFGLGKTYIHLDDVTKKDGPYTRPLTWGYGEGNRSIALGNVVPEHYW